MSIGDDLRRVAKEMAAAQPQRLGLYVTPCDCAILPERHVHNRGMTCSLRELTAACGDQGIDLHENHRVEPAGCYGSGPWEWDT